MLCKRQAWLLAVASLLLLLLFVGTLRASTVYNIDLDPGHTLYGTLDQANVVVPPGGSGATSCAPTATMNSFTYLQNAFPAVYGTNDELMGVNTSWLDAAIDLGTNYMNTSSDTGTSDENWINGKYNYLETYAPGKTIYAGYDAFTTGGQPWVNQAIPPIMFIVQQLQMGAAIEIGISPPDNGFGHVMTVSSIHWTDTDMDGVLDAGENATLDGIDPGGGAVFNYMLKIVANGGNTYLGFDGGPYNNYRIDAAMAGKAVPEPSTILLFSIGCLALLTTRCRR